MLIGRDVFPNEALSFAVERQRELVFSVIVPFKRNTLELPIEQVP